MAIIIQGENKGSNSQILFRGGVFQMACLGFPHIPEKHLHVISLIIGFPHFSTAHTHLDLHEIAYTT